MTLQKLEACGKSIRTYSKELKNARPSPISVNEFRRSMLSSLPTGRNGTLLEMDGRLALAVSGGVDSMALAVLCSKLQQRLFDAIALIVDHKARACSTKEAQITEARIHRLGLQAHILPIHWPKGTVPDQLSDFETQARKLRYQALGDACQRHGIPYLVTAHHNDDVAESVLMGIGAGESGQSARAIKPRGLIPECWGMHGVHTSGGHDRANKKYLENEKNLSSKPQDPGVFEKGGVEVVRPLLSFDKERLTSTCRHANVKWEEDETNVQVWRTPRNAVRAMLPGCKLPNALRKSTLLELWNRRRLVSADINVLFHAAEHSCDVFSLDVRSGVLKVRMATSIIPSILPKRVEKAFSSQRLAANVLECFVSAVSPQETIHLESLQSAVTTIFPDLIAQQLNSHNQSTSFTAGGVSFNRMYSPLEEHTRTTPASSTAQTTELDPTFVWVFHRQPFSARLPYQIVPPTYSDQFNESMSIPRFTVRRFVPTQILDWGPWQLWDGRYWIRIKNGTSKPIVIRPLLPTDIARLKDNVRERKLQLFKAYLKEVAPGKIRWTLPAIVQPAANEQIIDRIVALPSLQRNAQMDIFPQFEHSNIDYEIRYKKVSLRPRSSQPFTYASSGNLRDPYSSIRWHRNKVQSWQD